MPSATLVFSDRPHRRLFAATVFALIAVTLLATIAAPALAAPIQISYLVMPHPDDEYQVWSLVTGSGTNYKVIIYMTRGEQTAFCKNDSAAKNAYQGPLSPVGQPDYGEVNPLGAGTNIWLGMWTSTCKNSRIEGTLDFLTKKAQSDSSIPTGFSYRNTYSFTGNTSAGVPPRRYDCNESVTPLCTPTESRSAKVYNASNGMGKVIFFDLGDNDLTKEEVQWAIAAVRSNKSTLGIPTSLPDYNSLGAFRHSGVYSGCQQYDHKDHKSVHDALWQYDMINGKQHARTCSGDPDHDSGRTKSVTLSEHDATKQGSTTTRTGPFQKYYGWLAPGYWDWGWNFDEIRARTQYFWSRFS